MKFLVFIISDKAKTSRREGNRCRCYERRRAKELEEIEASHTLGGYRRCRCYSAVRYTIVNRFRRICFMDKGLVKLIFVYSLFGKIDFCLL